MNTGRIVCLLFTMVIVPMIAIGQSGVNEIMGDTLFKSPEPLIINNDQFGTTVGLVDRLPDGVWKYYRIKKFTKKENRNNTLLYEGTYKDSLKNGRFIIYFYPLRGAKASIPHVVLNYKNGVLHGPFVVYHSSGEKREDGNFKHGKKHGLFIRYRITRSANFIEDVELYDEDILIYSCKYFPNAGVQEQEFMKH